MTSNDYLNQVVQEQAAVEGELRRARKVAANYALNPSPGSDADLNDSFASVGPDPAPANYRITGFWLWKTVVVPPNTYVVHTRRGHADPLHVGLGLSFSYNPYRDAFLVVPAAMQTLLINARCICRERQGILVQAYVQWVVDDITTAYRRLDFSDPADPMRIVNIQLREQAEAALKDKVAMMSIEDVLSDKQPIIDELTTRLREVAEGGRQSDSGLGLKIVTVQIKEAVVSSTQLWQNLQKPFRAERERVARLAELDAQQQIGRQEQLNAQERATAQLEIDRQLALMRHEQGREQYDREQAERERRLRVEQEAERKAVLERTATERAQKEAELELALHQLDVQKRRITEELESVRRAMELERVEAERERLRATNAVEVENVAHAGRCGREERDLTLFERRRTAENALTPEHVRAQLIARLPEVAAALPRADEMKAISIGGDGASTSLVGFLAGAMSLLEERNGAK